jgi:pimeloyl-ACP methyl ester carboxylesterase
MEGNHSAHEPVRAPGPLLQFLEQRVPFEVGALLAASPFLRLVGRGDRHPVMVMPGFTGGDMSTVALRWNIRQWGYWAHGWGLGANLGPTREILLGIESRLHEIFERHGRTVSLVGWSLGGIFARELGRAFPEEVRQVVTLGSPFRMVDGDGSSAQPIVRRLESQFDPEFGRLAEADKPPLPVPSTAIYTRTDGVARWHTCIDAVSEMHENVEVHGSHTGLGFNPLVLYVIGNRLAQREGEWRPFRPPLWLQAGYPTPVTWVRKAPRPRERVA